MCDCECVIDNMVIVVFLFIEMFRVLSTRASYLVFSQQHVLLHETHPQGSLFSVPNIQLEQMLGFCFSFSFLRPMSRIFQNLELEDPASYLQIEKCHEISKNAFQFCYTQFVNFFSRLFVHLHSPTRMIGTPCEKCRISGYHLDNTLSNDVRLSIE